MLFAWKRNLWEEREDHQVLRKIWTCELLLQIGLAVPVRQVKSNHESNILAPQLFWEGRKGRKGTMVSSISARRSNQSPCWDQSCLQRSSALNPSGFLKNVKAQAAKMKALTYHWLIEEELVVNERKGAWGRDTFLSEILFSQAGASLGFSSLLLLLAHFQPKLTIDKFCLSCRLSSKLESSWPFIKNGISSNTSEGK